MRRVKSKFDLWWNRIFFVLLLYWIVLNTFVGNYGKANFGLLVLLVCAQREAIFDWFWRR